MTDAISEINTANIEGLQNDNLHAKFQNFVEMGMKKIDKNSLIAKFEYSKSNKSQTIEFIYNNCTESSKRVSPQIEIKITDKNKRNYSYNWNAKWLMGVSDNVLEFKPHGFSNWKLFEINDIASGGTSAFIQNGLPLPNTNKVDEFFLSFWFWNNIQDRQSSEVPAIKCIGKTGQETTFKQFWDALKLDGNKFSINDLPAVPDYDCLVSCSSDTNNNDENLKVEWARLFVSFLAWRFFLRMLSFEKNDNEKEKNDPEKENYKDFFKKRFSDAEEFSAALFDFLPFTKNYRPKRPVDINPQKIFKVLNRDELKVPWHVISSATAALNAGKHIIFTGPPGCGKTHLAKLISQVSSTKLPLMVTASQSWSTDEVIGRYMPTVDGKGLEFKYGFFLSALENNQWLVIDEINRCDIDNCFGELFTVLSGQSVAIPFDKKSEDGNLKPIRINVGGDSEENDTYESVTCSEKFRLLATMNDADIAGLHQLSYALRRRFAIIRVDAPDDKKKREVFSSKIDSVFDDLSLKQKKYSLKHKTNTKIGFNKMLGGQIEKLFACDIGENGYDDLIDLGVVGVAPVLDIIRFVGEGLRSPEENTTKITIENNEAINNKKAESQLLNSFLAMGIVLNIFPQLDSITNETSRFENALNCILNTFDSEEVFLKIEENSKTELVLVGTNLNSNENRYLTIKGYLIQELRRQYSKNQNVLGLIDKIENAFQKNNEKKSK